MESLEYGGGDGRKEKVKPSFFSPETGIYSSKHSPRPLPDDPSLDLVSFLFSFPHPHPGAAALLDSLSGLSISHADLRRLVASFAAGLHRFGISQSDVVLIALRNSILFPVVFLGALSAGAVVTPVNPANTAYEIEKQASALGKVDLILASPENLSKLAGLGAKIIAVPQILDFDGADAEKFILLRSLLSSNPRDTPMPRIRQTDTAVILYSSGTSGPSKGVLLTHRNLIAAVELFVRFEASQYSKLESWRNVYLAALPMFHVYGLSLFVMGILSLGSTIVVMPRFAAEDAARVIDRYGVTHLHAVPPMLRALIRMRDQTDAPAAGCYGLRSLVQVSSGAAPLSQKIIQDFVKAFPDVDFIQGYGMTESTAVGTRGFNGDGCKRYTSSGLLAPNMQAKIVDWNTGTCLPPGTRGELWLRGPAIMKGYLNNESATSSTIVDDGWLRTGDISYIDQDGYVYLVDRLKDTIKYKGYQISPADLEALLISHPDIHDVAVTHDKDEEAGEIPVAYIVRRKGSKLSSGDVIQYTAKQVAPYKKIRRVVFVNSIPRSAAGKILRRELKSNGELSSRM